MAGSSDARRAIDRARPAARRTFGYAFEGVLLALAAVLSWALSAVLVDPAWSVVALGLYLWFCTYLFRVDPRATVLILNSMIGRLSSFIALIAIEYGSRIPELGTVGTPGPYATSFLFYCLISYAAYAIAFRLIAERPGHHRTHPLTPLFDRFATLIALAILAFAGLLILWLLVRGAISGFPLLAGIDRFVYRRYTDPVTLYALNYKAVILFVIGMAAFGRRVARWVSVAAAASAVVLMLIYFLFGDKFFTQISAFLSFLTPYLYLNYEKVRRRFILFASAGALLFTPVFGVTWYIYSDGGSQSTAATMERLSGRLVGQGELWWLQARLGAPILNWDREFVDANLKALKEKEAALYAVQNSLGANYFSNRYAPDRIRDSMLRNAGTVTYTVALEPLGLAAFGWLGLVVVMVVAGLLLALTRVYIAFAITSRSPISALLALYVSVQVGTALAQGAPWTFLSVYALKWFAVAAAIEVGLYTLGAAQRGTPRSRRGMRRPANATG